MTRLILALLAPMLVSIAPALPPTMTPTPALPPASPGECRTASPDTGGPALGTASPARPAGGNLMAPRFGGGVGFFEVRGSAPGPRTVSSSPIELSLSGPNTRSTAQPLNLRLTITNRSAARAVVMRALDGSLEHWRHPHYDLYLRDEATQTVYRWDFHGGRCGNVNAIRDEDYVGLAPGGHDDAVHGSWANHIAAATVAAPGNYTAWVVYRFCGLGGTGLPLGSDVERADVTQGVFASNGVRVVVR